MNQFPAFPQTLITRQIECISCREIFTVSEDFPSPDDSPSPEWLATSTIFSNTQLRFLEDRNQQRVTPEPRTHPNQPRRGNSSYRHLIHINCPRCGTDNRNWLEIINGDAARKGYEKYPIQYAIIAFSCIVLTIRAFLKIQAAGYPLHYLLALIACIILAAIIPFTKTIAKWRVIRENNYFRKINTPPSVTQKIDPSLKSSLSSLSIYVLLIPFVFFLLMPLAFDTMSTLIESVEDNVPVVPGSSEDDDEDMPLSDNVKFLISWFLYTGFAGLVSIISAEISVNNIIRKNDKHLPRPLFYSVANMTRVVIWEANRALEIGGVLNDVQWTSVQRNEIGGIDLSGLFRDPPSVESTGRMSDTVRAQMYTVRSNRWGHIEEAYVNDTRVTTPAGSPLASPLLMEDTPVLNLP
ncbi:MAG: hypothetical protein GY943_16135 [Chloroflexi bacterium]|nr:hypothetical protein [Chloroflexota bacterium]